MKQFLLIVAMLFVVVSPMLFAQDLPVAKAIVYTPDSSVKFALADLLANVPPEEWPSTRYLSA